jgi:hypothetical protein
MRNDLCWCPHIRGLGGGWPVLTCNNLRRADVMTAADLAEASKGAFRNIRPRVKEGGKQEAALLRLVAARVEPVAVPELSAGCCHHLRGSHDHLLGVQK